MTAQDPSPSDLVQVRPATGDDVAGIVELLAPFVTQRKLLSRSEEEIRQIFRTGFVAERGGRLVGCAAVEIYSRKLAELQCLAVSASCQGLGVGRRLVGQCLELARQKNVLEVLAISSSEEFLKSCGFEFSLPDQKKALFYALKPRS